MLFAAAVTVGGAGYIADELVEARRRAVVEQRDGASMVAAVPRAIDVLATVDVKGRAPKTGYHRDSFGQRWADVDRNGCDTRNDILRRDLADVRLKAGTGGCKVLSGSLTDPYTGDRLGRLRLVQIDHVVPLSDAWQKGAQSWSADKRTRFANDPMNLLAVRGSANQQKGDGDAATWLPPRRAFWCDYVARQVAVKAEYGLWMTNTERDKIGEILATCPAQPIPG